MKISKSKKLNKQFVSIMENPNAEFVMNELKEAYKAVEFNPSDVEEDGLTVLMDCAKMTASLVSDCVKNNKELFSIQFRSDDYEFFILIPGNEKEITDLLTVLENQASTIDDTDNYDLN